MSIATNIYPNQRNNGILLLDYENIPHKITIYSTENNFQVIIIIYAVLTLCTR